MADGSVLTETESRVVELRMQGKTWREIGEELGMTKQAAHSHGVKPHVQAAIRGEHEDIIAAAKEKLADGFRVGLSALVEVAKDKQHRDRIQAAKALVGLVQPTKTEVSGRVEQVQVMISPELADEIAGESD